MAGMSPIGVLESNESNDYRDQLLERQRRLKQVEDSGVDDVRRLLVEVDEALQRIEDESFGICEVCHDHVEPERLNEDPLRRVCLECLSLDEQRALERDLNVASQIQRSLLPDPSPSLGGWDFSLVYEPFGSVSGDYVDVFPEGDDVLFFVGDVAGKGVAAALLMSHLHAVFRSLASTGLPLAEMVERANRILAAATMPECYATLVAGRLSACGKVELCNAGHNPPLFQSDDEVAEIDSTGLPIGLFASAQYQSRIVRLGPMDRLVLYTDGLTESLNQRDDEYGRQAPAVVLQNLNAGSANEASRALVRDLDRFRSGVPIQDDLSILVVQRSAA